MTLDTKHPRDFKYGIAEQSVWGTAIADNAAFVKLHCAAPDFSEEAKVLEQNLALGSRVPVAAEYVPHTKQILSKIAIPAMVVKKTEVSLWLYGIIQQVTEAATTPYGKTFTFDLDGQPDFTANAGKFFTFIEWDPVSGKARKWKDLVVSELVISSQPGDYLMVRPTLVGRGSPTHASTPSGTWTAKTATYLHYSDIDRATYNFGSSADFNLEGPWELAITRLVAGIGQDGAGGYQSLLIGKPDLSLKVSAVHGALTDTGLTARDAGTQGDFRIGIGNATAGTVDGDFDIACSGKVKVDSMKKNQAGEVTLVEVDVKILADDETSAPITIIVADAEDKAW